MVAFHPGIIICFVDNEVVGKLLLEFYLKGINSERILTWNPTGI
jgi:hypothetical protein